MVHRSSSDLSTLLSCQHVDAGHTVGMWPTEPKIPRLREDDDVLGKVSPVDKRLRIPGMEIGRVNR